KINLSDKAKAEFLEEKECAQFGNLLGESLWQSGIVLKNNLLTLENPQSLEQYAAALPRNLWKIWLPHVLGSLCRRLHMISKLYKILHSAHIISYIWDHKVRTEKRRIESSNPANRLEVGNNIYNLLASKHSEQIYKG
ncbi:3837_t:CDS:2, partial [Dentiscutata heterogama]